MKTLKYYIAVLVVACFSTTAMAQTDYKAALKPIRAAIEAAPTDPNAAKDLIKDYKKLFKKDAEAMAALGYSYFGVKNYEQAIAYADMAIKINKSCGMAYLLKGDVEYMQDNGGEAARWYQMCQINDPKNPDGYLRYASVYRKVDPQGAEEAINKLRKENPTFPVDAELGHALYEANDADKAYEYYVKSDKNQLTEARLAEFALVAGDTKHNDKALEIAEFGLSKFPQSAMFARLAIINAVNLEKYDEALTYVGKLENIAGQLNSGDAIYQGRALSGVERYDEAIQAFQKAIALDEKNIMPYQYLSETYAKMGQEDMAIEFSKKYLELNPNARPSDYKKLADVYMAKRAKGEDPEANYAKAMEVYDGVAVKYPQLKAWTIYQKANETFKAEMDEQALSLYLSLIKELEGNADRTKDETNYLATAYRNAGYIYWGTKSDLETAYPYFEKLLKLDPENALGKKFMDAYQAKKDEEAGALEGGEE